MARPDAAAAGALAAAAKRLAIGIRNSARAASLWLQIVMKWKGGGMELPETTMELDPHYRRMLDPWSLSLLQQKQGSRPLCQ